MRATTESSAYNARIYACPRALENGAAKAIRSIETHYDTRDYRHTHTARVRRTNTYVLQLDFTTRSNKQSQSAVLSRRRHVPVAKPASAVHRLIAANRILHVLVGLCCRGTRVRR